MHNYAVYFVKNQRKYAGAVRSYAVSFVANSESAGRRSVLYRKRALYFFPTSPAKRSAPRTRHPPWEYLPLGCENVCLWNTRAGCPVWPCPYPGSRPLHVKIPGLGDSRSRRLQASGSFLPVPELRARGCGLCVRPARFCRLCVGPVRFCRFGSAGSVQSRPHTAVAH